MDFGQVVRPVRIARRTANVSNHLSWRLRRPSLAGRMTLLTAGLLAIIYAGALGYLIDARRGFEATQQADLDGHAAMLAERTANALEQVDAALLRVASGLADDPLDALEHGEILPVAIHRALQVELRGLSIARALFVLDAHGLAVGSSDLAKAERRDFSDRDYFRAQRDGPGGLVIGRLIQARADALSFFSLSRPIRAADGHLLGVVVAVIDPRYFSDFQGYRVTGTLVRLVTDDGAVLVGEPGRSADGEDSLSADRHLAGLPLSVTMRQLRHRWPGIGRSGLLWTLVLLGLPSALAVALTRKVVREATARDRAERRLQDALDCAPAAFALFDAADRLVTCNAVFRDTYLSAGREAIREARAAASAGAAGGEAEMPLRDGRWMLIRDRATAGGGRVCFDTDVTALKQQEQTLRRSEQQLRDAHRLARIAYWERDLEVDRITWPTDMHPIADCPDLTPRTYAQFLDMIHPDDRAGAINAVADAAGVVRYEVRVRGPQGALLHFYVEAHNVHDCAGKLVRRHGICRDVTEVRRNEQILRDLVSHNRLLSQAVASSATAIVIADPNLDDVPIVYVNPAFRQLTGYDEAEAMGRNCRFLQGPDTDPATIAALSEAIAARRSAAVEVLNYRKDGTAFWNELAISPVFDDDGQLIAFLGMLKDVSLEREQENLLQQRQKLEALGRMAGGIAHELNNLLHPILTFGKLTLDEADPAGEVAQYQRYVLDSARQARDVVRKVLAFARAEQQPVTGLDFPETVRAAVDFATKLLPPSIETRVDIAPDQGLVFASESDVAQVVANLVHNAVQAMDGTGRLSISLARAAPADAEIRAANPGGFYRLTIADTGIGMSEDIRRRIFDPFFTTKPVGKGTGLGLSIVYGAVQSWGGTVEVASQPGAGSAFSVFVPITSVAASSDARVDAWAPSPAS